METQTLTLTHTTNTQTPIHKHLIYTCKYIIDLIIDTPYLTQVNCIDLHLLADFHHSTLTQADSITTIIQVHLTSNA